MWHYFKLTPHINSALWLTFSFSAILGMFTTIQTTPRWSICKSKRKVGKCKCCTGDNHRHEMQFDTTSRWTRFSQAETYGEWEKMGDDYDDASEWILFHWNILNYMISSVVKPSHKITREIWKELICIHIFTVQRERAKMIQENANYPILLKV